MKELSLVRLYFYLCEHYNKELCHYNQHFSNNSTPSNLKITDEELLTIYFYCRLHENRHSKKEIYDYAERYLKSWFPNLVAYANFNSRLNNLQSGMVALIPILLADLEKSENFDNQSINRSVSLIDSLPIMLCSGKRKGKVAKEISDKTFCASKGRWYYGVKLHCIAFSRPHKLPFPEFLGVTPASHNDLTAVKPTLLTLPQRTYFVDKAYIDQKLNKKLTLVLDSTIFTPQKLVKGESPAIRQFHLAPDNLYSSFVSANRQPIECFFAWLIQKTNIQDASYVRATDALILYIFGALATALLFWLF